MEKRSFINKSTVSYFSLLLLGIFAMIASVYIPRDHNGGIGARVFPMLSSGALILLGILGIPVALKDAPTKTKEKNEQSTLLQTVLLLTLSLFYVWIISKIGYLLSTALVSPLILMLFGIRNPLGLLVATILCPAVYHAVFCIGLGVLPPYGEWFDLLDLIEK